MFFKKLVAPLTKLRESLKKTRNRLGKAVRMVLSIGRKIDDELLEELEEALIFAELSA
ncbi:MAG: hypothetical protein U5N86_05300 [Planctomycetota bacterium]|nr:hypothetical protein [Planctomycetota bacterium]